MQELYRAFDFFNVHLAHKKLISPIITIASTSNQPMRGWFANNTWQYGKHAFDEINISAEHIDVSANEIMHTLLHEMAHLKNAQRRIIDIDLRNQYHNEAFKLSAESFGLIVHKGRKGYAYTSLGPVALKIIRKLKLNVKVFGKLRRK